MMKKEDVEEYKEDVRNLHTDDMSTLNQNRYTNPIRNMNNRLNLFNENMIQTRPTNILTNDSLIDNLIDIDKKFETLETSFIIPDNTDRINDIIESQNNIISNINNGVVDNLNNLNIQIENVYNNINNEIDDIRERIDNINHNRNNFSITS